MKPDWNFPDIEGDQYAKRDARLAIVKPLWEKGKSASEIAAHFDNCNRNKVIGILNRANLHRARKPKLGKRKAAPNPVKRTAPAKPKPIRNRNTVVAQRAEPHPAEPVASAWIDKERPPIEGTTPISILQLPNRPLGICRFPVQGGYCGVECGEKVYCTTHHAHAHVQYVRPDVAERNRKRSGAIDLARRQISDE